MSKFPFVESIKKFNANVMVEYLEKRIIRALEVTESAGFDNGFKFKFVVFNNFHENTLLIFIFILMTIHRK